MKLILTITLAVLLISACTPPVVAPSSGVSEPPVLVSTPTAYVPPVKEVEMATLTPALPTATPDTSLPTLDPNQPIPTSTSVNLPKTLEELGIPAITYEDKVSGLAFEYPSEWKANEVADEDKQNAFAYTLSLRSKDKNSGPKQQEGIPPDMAAIDVTVIKEAKTYEQAIDERRASATNAESGRPVIIQVEEEWTLRDGLKAHRFLLNLGKEPASGPDSRDVLISELVTIINGRIVLVTGYGDLSLFNVVAGSLRELK